VRILAWFCLVLGLVACDARCSKPQSKMTAEEVLESYLYIALNMENLEQRQDLQRLTSGALKAAIAGATDETMYDAYIRPQYKIESYSVVQTNDISETEKEITYQLNYKEVRDHDAHAMAVRTKNTVKMIHEDGKWFVDDVKGVTSHLDFPITRGISTIEGDPNEEIPAESLEDSAEGVSAP
jgi:hypothetical protein